MGGFNGAGVYERFHNWVQDKANSIRVRADRMDTEMDGAATALSNVICRDGQSTISANLPMNSKKLTGLAAGSGSGDSLRYEQLFVGSGTLTLGTSAVVGVGTLEIGHATDTTLARSSAGNLSIEGNVIYRAGGTDVPVADGGTGASTAAAGARALLNGLGTTKGNILWYNAQWEVLAPP